MGGGGAGTDKEDGQGLISMHGYWGTTWGHGMGHMAMACKGAAASV